MIRVCSQPARIESDHPALEAARTAVAALDLIGMAAAMLDQAGRTIAANPRFERLTPDVTRESRAQLQLVNAAAKALLSDALAQLASEPDCERVRSIPIAAADGQPPMILRLMSLHGARDLFPDALAVLVVLPVTPKEVPGVALLQGLFNLTPAEARVARAVAQRQTIGRIANSLRLSQETVRTQLKAVLAKTGVARNIDLAVTLAGAWLPTPSDPS